MKEKFQMWLAWRLPRWLVYFATVRAIAHATGGQYSNTVVPDLRAIEVLNRWKP
jgi:hypothetical protein